MGFLDMMDEDEMLLARAKSMAKSQEIIDAMKDAPLISLISVAITIFDIVEAEAGTKPEELFKLMQETREDVKKQLRENT
jgi:hypothetical protein